MSRHRLVERALSNVWSPPGSEWDVRRVPYSDRLDVVLRFGGAAPVEYLESVLDSEMTRDANYAELITKAAERAIARWRADHPDVEAATCAVCRHTNSHHVQCPDGGRGPEAA